MRHLLAIVAALLVPTVASASMVVVLCTPARCVAASDSRTWLRDDATGQRVRFRDDSVKVGYTGRFLLVATGASEGGVGLDVWPAWAALPMVAGETADQRADRLLRALQAQTVTTRTDTLTLVAVIGYAGPQPDGAVLRLRNVTGASAIVTARAPVTSIPAAMVFGWDELDFKAVGSRLQASLAPDTSEADMVALARNAINETAKTTDLVGGPVHILVIDKTGGRWIAR